MERYPARLRHARCLRALYVGCFFLCADAHADWQSAWTRLGLLRISCGASLQSFQSKAARMDMGRDQGLSCRSGAGVDRRRTALLYYSRVSPKLVADRLGSFSGIVRADGATRPCGVV